jgi:uncharacterized protein YdhG (YjbR/CyaY superfamily)
MATLLNDVRKVLQKHRHTIKSIAPEAEERISYGAPITTTFLEGARSLIVIETYFVTDN